MKSNLTVKTSVCWATTHNVEGTHILKMEFNSLYRDIKYSLEINLMGLVIQSVRPNHFSKELLKFIFYEIRFHKIYMNNLKD